MQQALKTRRNRVSTQGTSRQLDCRLLPEHENIFPRGVTGKSPATQTAPPPQPSKTPRASKGEVFAVSPGSTQRQGIYGTPKRGIFEGVTSLGGPLIWLGF